MNDETPVHMNFEAYMGLIAEKNAFRDKLQELEQDVATWRAVAERLKRELLEAYKETK